MGLLPHSPSPIEAKGLKMCGRSRMQVLLAKGATIQRDQRTAESPRMVSQLGLSFLLTIIGHPAMRLSARNLLG